MTAPKRPRPHRSRPTRSHAVPPQLPDPVPVANQKTALFLVALGFGSTLLAGAVLAGLYFAFTNDEPDIPAPVAASESRPHRERNPSKLSQISREEMVTPLELAKREADKKRAADLKAKQQPIKPAFSTPKETGPVKNSTQATVVLEESWDRDLKKLNGYLLLPSRDQTFGVTATREAEGAHADFRG